MCRTGARPICWARTSTTPWPATASRPADYRLDITLIEKRYPRGLNLDNTADRYEAHLTVNYQLVQIGNGKVLKTGSAPVEVSYAASGEPYAGIAAQQDAQKRAAGQAAQRIRIDLAAYFTSQAAGRPERRR